MQGHSLLTVITVQATEKAAGPTLAQIPIKEQTNPPFNIITAFPPQSESNSDERVIPGYNFQSLFRKKSHVRLARKKHKDDSHRKSATIKLEHPEGETRQTQRGHWSAEENKLYHWFLEIHSEHFIRKHLRRTDKIFKAMASFIKSREAEQCRSHHQKMEKKYHSFYQILLKLRVKFYESPSEELLRLELEQNNFKIPGVMLISAQQLTKGEVCKLEEIEARQSSKSAEHSIEYEKESNNEHSLLGENYERQLNFHFQS